MQSGDMKHIRPLELDPGLTAIKEEEGILSSLPPWRNEDLFLNSLHTLLIISKDFRGGCLWKEANSSETGFAIL